jgi:cell division protein ZapA
LDSEQITTVEIFNRTYKLRSGGNSDYVQRLAEHLDTRMVALSRQTPTVDSLKIAILAALSITDEYLTLEQEHQKLRQEISEKVERMNGLLKPFAEDTPD